MTKDLLGNKWKPNDFQLVRKGASPRKVNYATSQVLKKQPDQVNIDRKDSRDDLSYRQSRSAKKDIPQHQTSGKQKLLEGQTTRTKRFGAGLLKSIKRRMLQGIPGNKQKTY